MANWKWDRSYDEDQNFDWLLVRDGPIVKYFSSQVLEEDINELDKIRYQIIDLSVSSWTTDNAHKRIKEMFGFPDYYGENRAAFRDCLNDKFDRKCNGLVIALRHFDSLYYREKSFSEDLLDDIVSVTWTWLLAGKKIITLIQSDNPDFGIDKVGGFKPSWNQKEWANSAREVD